MTARDWRPSAAYLYTLHLDSAGLAWEYLRRNADYRRDWDKFGQVLPADTVQRWGLKFMEDPSRDAREVQPRWMGGSSSLVRLIGTDEPSEKITFSLWKIGGAKLLFHDGVQLLLTAHGAGHTLRASLDASVRDGGALAFAVPASNVRASWPVLCHVASLMGSRERQTNRSMSCARPKRRSLLDMHTLQALDGDAAGASHREIARAVFGAQDVFERWATNSELRAQIRYLLRRGRGLVGGRYLELLNPLRSVGQGETHSSPDSP